MTFISVRERMISTTFWMFSTNWQIIRDARDILQFFLLSH